MRSIQSTLFTLLVASSATYADTTLNLTRGVSPISRDIYDLHMMIFWICVVIGIGVFGVMFYSMLYHRKSKGAKSANFHSHSALEITWTIVPALILILMAIPATKVLFNINNYDQEDLTIKITGYQWKWHYEYIEDNLNFFSNLSTPYDQIHGNATKSVDYLREVDHPLVVPIHKKIRFLITSNDVNHAWWVPDLGVKRDAISGFINEAWTIIDKPGTYRGQCAELCGVNHAFMPIVVIATTEQGYKDWVAKQKGQATAGDAETNKNWTMQELMVKGEEIYGRICAACHQPGGVGQPPTFPALKGSKVATGSIAEHVDTVFNGRSGTAMQAFKNQLSDVELAAIVTYERNAWGNNTNTLVQPIQIKALRDGKTMDQALATQPTGNAPAATPPAPTTTPPSGGQAVEPAAPANAPATPITTAPAAPVATPSTATPAPAAGSVPAPTSEVPPPAAPTVTEPSAPAAAAPAASTATVPAPATTSAPVATTTAPAPASTGVAPATPTAPAPTSTPSTSVTPTATTPAATPAPAAQPVAANSADALKVAITNGEKVYLNTCVACHQPTGVGMPPTFPALKGSPIATGPVAGHINRVLNGKQGTAMVAFKDQLSDQDLADVITYERNAWGNNTGTLVTPDQIKAARQQVPTE